MTARLLLVPLLGSAAVLLTATWYGFKWVIVAAVISGMFAIIGLDYCNTNPPTDLKGEK